MENATEIGWRMTGSANEVADILVEFAEELRKGDVTVWKGQRELHIDPTGQIHMSVHADSEPSGNADLRIELKWNH
jgi:amphi-Trp domain-containing protein